MLGIGIAWMALCAFGAVMTALVGIAYFQAHPELTLAARPSAQGRRDMALDVATGLLQAHPEIRGIFAINDETGLGVLSALQALGRDDVVVVAYDAIPEARRAIQAGTPPENIVAMFDTASTVGGG